MNIGKSGSANLESYQAIINQNLSSGLNVLWQFLKGYGSAVLIANDLIGGQSKSIACFEFNFTLHLA